MALNKQARPQPLKSESFWIGKDGLDEGIYEQAASEGKSVTTLLEDFRAQTRGQESPYVGLTFHEIVDRKNQIRKETGNAPLTAFEECIKTAGIQTTGWHTDTVNKFYEVGDIDVLFPEYVANNVYAGKLKSSIVPLFSAATRQVDSETFEKIYLNDLEIDRHLQETGRGENFPATEIVVGTEKVRLLKYGRYLQMSDEELRFQRLNVFNLAMQRIGIQLGIDESDEMVYILINGDGNSNTPGTTTDADTSGSIGVADVIEFANSLPTPYKMNRFIGKKALLNDYYTTLSAFTNFSQMPGNVSDNMSIVGIQLPMPSEWDRSVVPTDYFIGVDTGYAIEHVTWGAIRTESERLIRSQINGTAVSSASGFGIIDENAVGLFDQTA